MLTGLVKWGFGRPYRRWARRGVHAVGFECDFWRLKRSRPLLYQRAFNGFQSQKRQQHHTANTTKKKKEKRLPQSQKWNKTQNKKRQTPKKTQRRDMRGYYPGDVRTCREALLAGHVERPCWQDMLGHVERPCWQDMLRGLVGRTCREALLAGHVDWPCWQEMLGHVDWPG